MSRSRASRRVYGGQSHADRMAERRAAFIEAGFQLIGTEGYRAATVRAVCKQAGITDRYFYELFGNTEGLLIAVYETVAEALQQALMQALAEADDECAVVVAEVCQSIAGGVVPSVSPATSS